MRLVSFKRYREQQKIDKKGHSLLAMMNVLGPFQWFLTFGCFKLRWPQIIACIQRKKRHKVDFVDEYISKENVGILVDEMPLKEDLSSMGQTIRGITHKETFLVTRMFDYRVKSFI